MKKFNFPLQIPPDRVLTLTQPMGPTSNTLEPKGPEGEPHFHYGVDVVDGLPAETYGTPIVMPFAEAKLEGYLFDGAATPQTNYAKFSGVGASGIKYTMILAHISALFFKDKYREGDVVALVGNNGLVSPTPTPGNPFAGSHLHLGCTADGEWIDPLSVFDIGNPYRGPAHSGDNNVPRIQWALDLLRAEFEKIKSAMH